MTWNVKKIGSAILLISLVQFPPAFAKHQKQYKGYKNSQTAKTNGGWIVGLEGGAAWPDVKNYTTVFNGSDAGAPFNGDYYTMRTDPKATAVAGVYAGYRFVRHSKAFPSYSIAGRYQRLTKFRIQGDIQQYSLPDFTNYTYKMNVVSNIFTLQGKLDLYEWGRLTPYFSAGIGVASNYLSDYSEQPTSGVIARDNPAFQNNTLNNFTFNIGAGISMKINRQWSANLGYEFANLGKLKSHAGAGADWYSESISLGTLTTQAALLSLTYQFS